MYQIGNYDSFDSFDLDFDIPAYDEADAFCEFEELDSSSSHRPSRSLDLSFMDDLFPVECMQAQVDTVTLDVEGASELASAVYRSSTEASADLADLCSEAEFVLGFQWHVEVKCSEFSSTALPEVIKSSLSLHDTTTMPAPLAAYLSGIAVVKDETPIRPTILTPQRNDPAERPYHHEAKKFDREAIRSTFPRNSFYELLYKDPPPDRRSLLLKHILTYSPSYLSRMFPPSPVPMDIESIAVNTDPPDRFEFSNYWDVHLCKRYISFLKKCASVYDFSKCRTLSRTLVDTIVVDFTNEDDFVTETTLLSKQPLSKGLAAIAVIAAYRRIRPRVKTKSQRIGGMSFSPTSLLPGSEYLYSYSYSNRRKMIQDCVETYIR